MDVTKKKAMFDRAMNASKQAVDLLMTTGVPYNMATVEEYKELFQPPLLMLRMQYMKKVIETSLEQLQAMMDKQGEGQVFKDTLAMNDDYLKSVKVEVMGGYEEKKEKPHYVG